MDTLYASENVIEKTKINVMLYPDRKQQGLSAKMRFLTMLLLVIHC